MSIDLPPDLELLSRLVSSEPPQVREIFHYALVMMMVEDGKAKIIETKRIDGRKHIFVRTIAGDLFSVVKPAVSEELLERTEQMAREIFENDNPDQSDAGAS